MPNDLVLLAKTMRNYHDKNHEAAKMVRRYMNEKNVTTFYFFGHTSWDVRTVNMKTEGKPMFIVPRNSLKVHLNSA